MRTIPEPPMQDGARNYHYCANPLCEHRRISLLETGFDSVYAVAVAPDEPEPQCPYCESPLVRTCPGCGRVATSRPLRFCPACGANLLGRKRETHCVTCGKPMRVASVLPGDVPCCSERCLQVYLLQNVKTCDQCGMRFNATGGNGTSFVGLLMQGQGGRKFDFCSTGCLEKYSAEHGVLLHCSMETGEVTRD